MANIAKLVVELQAKADSFGTTMDAAGSKLDAIGTKATALGKSMSLKVTAPIVAMGTAAVMTFANFEQQMANVRAVADLTGTEFEQLSTLARQIGIDTSFSATEAAFAMEELAKAGIPVADIMDGGARAVVDLSAAAGVTLPNAAAIMASSMNLFNIAGSEATTVADMFAAAANKSQADVDGLGTALASVGNTAVLFGLDLDDTLTALSIFADSGIEASMSGTTMRSMLLSLLNPTTAQSDAMEALGLNVFDAEGKFIGLEAMSGQLAEGLDRVGEQEFRELLSAIFGTYGISGAIALTQQGAEGWQDYNEAINTTGAAADAAAIRQGTLLGSIERMRGAIDEAFIAFGERLAPTIERVAGIVERGAERFAALDARTQTLIATVLAIAAAIGPLLIVFGAMASAIGPIITAIGLLVSPIGLVIAAIALLFVAYQTNFLGFRDGIGGAVSAVSNFLQTLFSRFDELRRYFSAVIDDGDYLNDWLTHFPAGWQPTIEMIGRVVAAVAEAMPRVREYVSEMVDAVTRALSGWVDVVKGIMQVLKGVFTGDWELIKTGVVTIVNGMKEMVLAAFDAWKAGITLIIDALKVAIPAAWEFIKENAGRLAGEMKTNVVQIFTGMKDDAVRLAGDLKTHAVARITELKNDAVARITELKSTMTQRITDLKNDAIARITDLKTQAVQRFTELKDSAVSKITEMKDSIIAKGQELLSGAGAQLDALKASVTSKFTEAKTSAITTVTDMVTGVIDLIASIPGKIVDALGDLSTLLVDAGKQVIGGLTSGITDAMPSIDGVLGGITDKIPDWKGPPVRDKKLLYESGRLIMDGLQRGMQSGWTDVERQLRGFTGQIGMDTGGGFVGGNNERPIVVIQTLEPGKWREFLENSELGAEFARNYGSAVETLGAS